MRTARLVAALSAGAVLLMSTACSSPAGGTVPETTAPPPRQAPIIGLSAIDLLGRAQTALAGSAREDFIEPMPGFATITKSAIGYSTDDGGSPNSSTPSIDIS
jgi:hypothetical protein